MTGSITVRWPAELNEHGAPLLWFGSWLTGSTGAEGSWFYSGRGGEHAEYPIPAEATGLRIRRWPNEGLDAEYSDVIALDKLSELLPAALDFDAWRAKSARKYGTACCRSMTSSSS